MKLRWDKFIWSVRLAKTRSIATELLAKGKIKICKQDQAWLRSEANSLNKKVWAQTELWGKSVPDLKIAFFKKSLVLAGTKLSMGLA